MRKPAAGRRSTGTESDRWRHPGAPIGLLAATTLALLAGCDSGTALTAAPAAPVAWVATHSFESEPGDTIVPVDLGARRTGPARATASEPAALATAPGGRLLVANKGDDTLSVLNASTGAVMASVRVGLEPDAVAFAPGGTRGRGVALVADFGDDDVTPVDLGTMRAGRPVAVGRQPAAVAVAAPAGGGPALALVANFGGGTVTPIDLATMRADPPVAVGTEPDAIAVVSGTGGGSVALICNFGSDDLTPLELPGLQTGAGIPIGGDPTGIAVDHAETAWVVAGASLVPVATRTLAPGAPVVLPDVGEAVALAGTGKAALETAWVAEQDGTVVPVPLGSRRPGSPVTVGGRPSAIVITH